jgi:hypothetical protein
MKQILFALLIAALTLAACTPATPTRGNVPPNAGSADYHPQPGDSKLLRETVFLDSIDLLILESFPLQFMLVLKGNLPTPCHALRVVVSEPDAQNQIAVDVYSLIDLNTTCIQVLEPFEVNVPLGSFAEGKYTLWVNGELAAEFQA